MAIIGIDIGTSIKLESAEIVVFKKQGGGL
jgi:hypothetical protein